MSKKMPFIIPSSESPLVPYEEPAIQAWLAEQGPPSTPMRRACMKGQINVCKWLHAHGAAPDATSWDKQGVTSVQVAVRGGRGRGYHQARYARCYSHVGCLPWWPSVGVQVAV